MDVHITITGRDDPDFLQLTQRLTDEYVALYGDEALDFCPATAMAGVVCAAVAHCDDHAAASGAFRPHDSGSAELMRIYVLPEYRRQGLGAHIVRALEQEALRCGFSRAVLVTGSDMPAALALYESLGYACIKNYGPNRNDPLCVCMEKRL